MKDTTNIYINIIKQDIRIAGQTDWTDWADILTFFVDTHGWPGGVKG